MGIHKEKIPKNCVFCGTPFLAVRTSHKFCSEKCQTAPYKQQHKQKIYESDRNGRIRLREKVLKLFGGVCEHCGFSDSRALQLDHKFRAKERIGTTNIYHRLLDGREPIEDFQLLCANCNWIKRVENKEYSHGKKGLRWFEVKALENAGI